MKSASETKIKGEEVGTTVVHAKNTKSRIEKRLPQNEEKSKSEPKRKMGKDWKKGQNGQMDKTE